MSRQILGSVSSLLDSLSPHSYRHDPRTNFNVVLGQLLVLTNSRCQGRVYRSSRAGTGLLPRRKTGFLVSLLPQMEELQRRHLWEQAARITVLNIMKGSVRQFHVYQYLNETTTRPRNFPFLLLKS